MALRDASRRFDLLLKLPIQDWPTTSLATSFDFCREELENLDRLLVSVGKDIRASTLSAEDAAHFHERQRVLAWRINRARNEVNGLRLIHESETGPVITFAKRTRR